MAAVSLDIRTFQLQKLVDEIAARHRAAGPGSSVEIVDRTGTLSAERVFGDANRIEKALDMLVTTARAVADGPVSILLDLPDVESAAPGDLVDLAISVRFAPGAGTVPAVPAPVHAYATSMDATVETVGAADAAGPGFRLTVLLLVAEDGPAAPALNRADGSPLRVLIAEDDPMSQTMITVMIERTGAEVRLVRDGAAAVNAWREGGVDLILMDMRMAGGDGIEATSRIRAAEVAEGRAPVPIIAVTAGATAPEIALCHKAGVDAVLPKPIQMDFLYARIRNLLSRRG